MTFLLLLHLSGLFILWNQFWPCMLFSSRFYFSLHRVHVLTIREYHVILVKICFMRTFISFEQSHLQKFIGYNIRCSRFFLLMLDSMLYCCVFICVCARACTYLLKKNLLVDNLVKKGTVFDDHTFMWRIQKPKGIPRNRERTHTQKNSWRPNEKKV